MFGEAFLKSRRSIMVFGETWVRVWGVSARLGWVWDQPLQFEVRTVRQQEQACYRTGRWG
jgi:hypothetical protein